MKIRIIELLLLVCLIGFTQIGQTNSYFSDTELSSRNTMTAGYWESGIVQEITNPFRSSINTDNFFFPLILKLEPTSTPFVAILPKIISTPEGTIIPEPTIEPNLESEITITPEQTLTPVPTPNETPAPTDTVVPTSIIDGGINNE